MKYVEQPTRAQIIREQKRISNYPWLDEKMTRVNRFTVRLTNYGTPWEDCGASLKVLIEENNQLATFILIDTGAAKEIFNARKLSSENERRLPEPDSSVKF